MAVDELGEQHDDLERVDHRGVVELVIDRVLVLVERAQGDDLDPAPNAWQDSASQDLYG